MDQVRIGYIGDSITHGTGDKALLGWPLRMGRTEGGNGHAVVICNMGVRADVSDLPAAHGKAECVVRPRPAYGRGAVFARGINDGADEKSGERDGMHVPLVLSTPGIPA